MSLPKYESYKDSGVEWLGEVPKHWDIMSLKRICDVRDGTHDTPTFVDETEQTFPLVTSKDIVNGLLNFTDTKHISEADYISIAKRSEVVHGDILMPMIGSIGGAVIVNSDKNFAIKNIALFKQGSAFTSFWLMHLLNSKLAIIQFELERSGGVQGFISLGTLRNLRFPIPNTTEQLKIANFLDQETTKIDNLIAEQQQLIELLKEKRQAVISHAVTKGLNPDVPMKDSGVEWLGEVPEHWGIVRLRYLCKIETGDADTVDSNEDGSYPFFVRSPNIEKINRYTHDCEAILTAGDGVGVGKVFHYFDGKFCAHQRVYIFRQFEGVQGKFFFHYLKELFLRVVLEGTAKSTVDSLRRPMIADFLMTVPYIEEQSIIAEFLDKETAKIDNLIAESTNLISLSKERRSALISSAVTGKIDVRNYVSTQPQIEAMT